MKELEKILGEENVKYNEPMSKHTSFKVGGNADIFLTIDTKEKLQKTIPILQGQKIIIIGNGSNLLVKDSGIRGVVIKYTAKKIEIMGETVIAEAGITNARLAHELLKNGLSGFEFGAGIPGTIGGAIVMNAGAFGGEMKNIVEETEYINLKTNEIKTARKDEHNFEYRKSKFSNENVLILKTILKLKKENEENIQNRMNEYAEKRRDSQPLNFPSAGSTFKRGNDFISAKLIDEAELKGYSIGGAEVSTKHAGFIINKGNATAKDIIDLIEYVQKVIFEKYGKKLETEVKIIGE